VVQYKKRRMKKRYFLTIFVLTIIAAAYFSNRFVAVQPGLAFAGPVREATDLKFLSDTSWQEPDGSRMTEQVIFDEALTMISESRQFVLLDMFLFNNFQGPKAENMRPIASELTAALVAQKNLHPDMTVTVITDPINTVYGGMQNVLLEELSDVGIRVVLTKLSKLRHSNPVYSYFWNWFVRPFGNRTGVSTLPSPFGEGRVSLRSYLALLNFKANHRKILVTDNSEGHYTALITSANPHDGSSAHRNVALRFSGAAVLDVIEAENAVLALSGEDSLALPTIPSSQVATEATVQILTESKIKHSILNTVNKAVSGDRLRLLLFYLSDRDVISALSEAAARGVTIELILDVNIDAFGHEKNGIPNKPVASELVSRGVNVRWCDTSGEQCHAKMLLLETQDEFVLLQGSANFTRRNLHGFNLETDVMLVSNTSVDAIAAAHVHFDTLWRNANEKSFTVSYEMHADESWFKKWLYRFMESSGLSTF